MKKIVTLLLLLTTISWSFSQKLAAFFPFNGNANDESGNQNLTTVYGAKLVNDRFGNPNSAYYFDGKSHIHVKDHPSIRLKTLTYSAWYKFDQNGPSTQIFFAKHIGSAYVDSYAQWIESGELRGSMADSKDFGTYISYPFQFVPDKWYHFVYMFDDITNIQKMYVDGKLVKQQTENKEIEYDSKPLLIGAANDWNVPQWFFHGTIDDIKIFNAILADTQIQDLSSPSFELSSKDVVSCQADNQITVVVKSGMQPFSYLWENGSTTQSIVVTNTIPSNSSYKVTVTDGCGQKKIQSINVKINAVSSANIFCDKTEFCIGNKIPIIVNFIGTAPWEYIYSINNVEQKAITTTKNPDTIFAVKAGNYKLTKLNNNICATVSGEVNLNEVKVTNADAGLNQSINCKIEEVIIGNNNNSPLYDYSWSNGSKDITQKTNVAGTYYLTVTDNKTLCKVIDSVKVVLDKAIPIIKINTNNSVSCKEEKIKIDASASSKGNQFLYEWEGVENSEKNNLTPLVSKEGSYILKITNKDNGCVAKDSVNVKFCIPQVYVPNIFSPDDNGINDNFTIFADENSAIEVNNLEIYNRWGDLIYKSNDLPLNNPDKGWDGTFKGNPVPKGVYIWIADILLIDKSVKRFTGEVLVSKSK